MDKSIPYDLRINHNHATNLIFRKNRSQCCLNKRRRTSVLRACAGGAEGDFNKNQLDKLEFKYLSLRKFYIIIIIYQQISFFIEQRFLLCYNSRKK